MLLFCVGFAWVLAGFCRFVWFLGDRVGFVWHGFGVHFARVLCVGVGLSVGFILCGLVIFFVRVSGAFWFRVGFGWLWCGSWAGRSAIHC